MKAKIKYILSVIVSLGLVYLVLYINDDKSETISQTARKKFKEGRKEWIEEMHKTSGNIDWRKIKSEIKHQKLENVLTKRRFLSKGNLLKSNNQIVEEIADGYLKGSWIEIGSANVAGRIETAEIDFDGEKVYVVADGGQVWVSPLEGNDWESISDYMKFNDAMTLDLIKFEGIKRIFVGDRSPAKLMYTDDEGISWNKSTGLSDLSSYSKVRRTLFTNEENPVIYAYVWDYSFQTFSHIAKIYRSYDNGETFNLFKTLNKGVETDLLMTLDNRKLLVQNNALYELQDDGRESLIAQINLNAEHKFNRDLTSLKCGYKNDSLYLYLMGKKDKKCFFYRSVDAGRNWEYRGEVPEEPFSDGRSFAVSKTEPDNIYVGGVNCYKSSDGGKNWNKVNDWTDYMKNEEVFLHADIPEVKHFYDENGKEYMTVCTDGGLYISENQLDNVKNITMRSMHNSQYYSIFTHPEKVNYIWAGSQDQGFQVSNIFNDSELKDFRVVVTGDYGHLVSTDNKVIWSVYPGFLLRTRGITSVATNSLKFEYPNTLWMPPIINDPENPDKVYLGGGTATGAHIYEMTYSSGQITEKVLPFDFDENQTGVKISALSYSPFNSDDRYVLNTNGSFFYSYDSGNLWRKANFKGPGSHYFYGAAICPSKSVEDKIYIGGNGYNNPGVFVSYDNGQTFESMDNGLPQTLVFDLDVSDDDRFLFAATEVGPYVYIKEKEQWFDLAGISAPAQEYWTVQYLAEEKRVRFGTYGRGIWDFKISEITSVNIIEPGENYEIKLNNYPNPFNPSTQIRFSLNEQSEVKINIYNTNGELIKNLFTGEKEKGDHQIDWNGGNNNGNEVSSGVYIVRLAANSKITSHKVIKIK